MRLLLSLTLLLGVPAALSGQAGAYRVAIELPPDRQAYPASVLTALGASVEVEPGGVRVVLLGDTLDFQYLSPYFRAAGRVHQLVRPVGADGGQAQLPRQFFTEWLPGRYPEHLAYADAALRAIGPAPGAAPVPAPTQRTAPGAAASQRVVILDPGHGGPDPGKIGPGGVREKDVTLAVGLRLAEVLRDRGYEVHLTRTTDTLVSLADRPRLANDWKAGRPAALFVSLHANSGPSSAQGFETFFLSEARTEDERRVAEMENAAIQYEDPAAVEALPDLEFILKHLRNDYYMRASNDLAEVIQRRFSMFHPGPSRGVKQAGFRVLVGAFMPAVLVELAFISNAREAMLLANAGFQGDLARGLADAIDHFFTSNEHLWAAGPAP